MAFSSPPEVVSTLGDADVVRHVYVSGLTKSYAVWAARLSAAGYSLIMRPSDAVDFASVDFSDLVVAGPFGRVLSFAAKETSTPSVVAIVFEQSNGLWVVEYDCANEVLSSGPTQLYEGTDPAISVGVSNLLLTYLREGALKLRSSLAGSEKEITRPSSTDIIDQDAHEKVGVPTVVRYAGLVGQNAEVARKFVAEAGSECVLDSSLSTLLPGSLGVLDEVDGGDDGIVGDNVTTGSPSPIGVGSSYLFATPVEEQEYWGLQFGPYGGIGQPPAISLGDQWSLHFWMITPQINYSTVFLQMFSTSGEYLNFHLPWSDGNLYFDVYDAGSNLDRINKSLGAVPGMEHWVFTQNSVTGVRKIFRDGVEWHSGTGLFNSLPDINLIRLGHSDGKVYGWDGEIAEFGIFGYDMSLEEAQTLNAGLPGYLDGDEPGLARLWRFDDSDIVTALTDLSGNGNHAVLNGQDYDASGIEITNVFPDIDSVDAGAGVTVEAWVRPRMQSYEAYVVQCDELAFGYKNTGKLFFSVNQPSTLYTGSSGSISSFADGGGGTSTLVNSTSHGLSNGAVISIIGSGFTGYYTVFEVTASSFKIPTPYNVSYAGAATWYIVPTVEFLQTSGRTVDANALNYVAVSHVFGDESSTFMVVNGSEVDAGWVLGSGDMVPGFTTLNNLKVRLGYRDRLLQWHIRSVAKNLSEILDYSKGRV
jgi:hypothetical protein